MDAQEKRGFLSDIKRAAYSISRDIQRSFRDLEQTIQPDEFRYLAVDFGVTLPEKFLYEKQ